MVATGCLLGACGSSGSAAAGTPRGTVSAFDADVSSHRDAAACALLGATTQAVLIGADNAAHGQPGCAAALASSGTRRVLYNLRIPAAAVAHTTLGKGIAGQVTLQSDKPVPVTYTLTASHDHWLITEF